MERVKSYVVAALCCASGWLFADQAPTPEQTPNTQQPSTQMMGDCSKMAADMQQFASQLSTQNRMIFCGQFDDGQRAAAMKMTSQPGAGGMTMSPDQAVEAVASSTNATPSQKTPAGCPVK